MTSKNVIRPKEIKNYVGLSQVSVWRLEKQGKFPKRRRLSVGAVGWLVSEVNEWLQSRETKGE